MLTRYISMLCLNKQTNKRTYTRKEVCLLFKHISFLDTSCKGGKNLGGSYG